MWRNWDAGKWNNFPKAAGGCGARIGAGQAGHRAMCIHAPLGCQLTLSASCWFPLAMHGLAVGISVAVSPWCSLGTKLGSIHSRLPIVPQRNSSGKKVCWENKWRTQHGDSGSCSCRDSSEAWRQVGGCLLEHWSQVFPGAGMGTMLLMWEHFQLAWRGDISL